MCMFLLYPAGQSAGQTRQSSNTDANHEAMLLYAQRCSAPQECDILAHAPALGLMGSLPLNSTACLQGHDLTCHTTMSMS